ncbi:MAG: beta-propeller fold lactonase family protein, partial [Bacteroidales bacterium]|nr:beta-propeller fold lactonase family protein [Bacteroidales bacterium]
MNHIKGFFGLLAALVAVGCTQEVRILVGTYTENTAAEGVYLYSFNTKSAEAKLMSMAPSGNPSFVIAAGDRAYAVNEFYDGRQGVSSFALSGTEIVPINSVPISPDVVPGEDPCNILFTGKAVITSNYSGGSVTAFSIADDGSIGNLSQSYVPETG